MLLLNKLLNLRSTKLNTRIEQQLERVYRRYYSSRVKVDYVECCDLAHCLRLWGGIAKDKSLQSELAKINRFRCAKPNSKSAKIIHKNDAEYTWLFMPMAACLQKRILLF